MMNGDELTARFYAQIPITRQMEIRVLEATSRKATLAVPLAPNLNHVQTAFGGSLYSAAALACYALFLAMRNELGEQNDHLVIQEGKMAYQAPVTSDFLVEATVARAEDRDRFQRGVRRRNRARIELQAQIFCQNKTCAQFSGVYVYIGNPS